VSTPPATTGTARSARILIISPWETVWSLGGQGDVRAGVSDDDRFIDAFTRAGYELHFLRPRASRSDERVTTHTYPNFFRPTRSLPTWLRRPLWPLLFNALVTPRALAYARRARPALVLGHSHYSTAAAWWCGKQLHLPTAVKLFGVMDLVHTEWPPLRYWFKNVEQILALRYPQDAWIVLDDGTRGDRAVIACGVPSERVHFLPNGLNTEWLERSPGPADRATARERFGLPADGNVVLFVARLVAVKRATDAIRAVKDLDAVLVIAGDGPERGACEQMAKSLGIEARVRFLGAVAHDDIPVLMDASDVFVSTGSTTNRALPTCEAMLCGVPVVVYDTGDTTTVVQDGKTGRVVADGDVAALARSLADLLADAGERARLSAGARDLARDVFVSWEQRLAREMALIQSLIAKQPH